MLSFLFNNLFSISVRIFCAVAFLLALCTTALSQNDKITRSGFPEELNPSAVYKLNESTANIDGIVDGYVDKLSYNPGDLITVYINSDHHYEEAQIFLYNIMMQKVDSLEAEMSPQCIAQNNPWENYGYQPTCTYRIPDDLPSGMYSFGNTIFFIVKSGTKDADITVVYPSNTEAAYNNAGGKSLYDFNSDNLHRVYSVTFQRPLSQYTLTNIIPITRPCMRWLFNHPEFSVQYIADSDMDDFSEIVNSKLVVVIGHSEYWTRNARNNFDLFVDGGQDAAVLSGNTMWWQVRYNEDESKLICYKDQNLDPISDPLLKTIEWPTPSLNYPTRTSIACDWINGAYGMHSYHGQYGYTITLPQSPIFEGIGLSFHSYVSCQSYEYDGLPSLGKNIYGDPIIDSAALGFCKIEMLGYDSGHATMTYNQPRGFGNFVVFRKTPNSGIIINTAFNNFTGGPGSTGAGGMGGPDSAKIDKMVFNMFSKLLAKENVFARPEDDCGMDISIALNNSDNRYQVFPNPSSGEFNIKMNDGVNDHCVLECYNSIGELVIKTSYSGLANNKVDLTMQQPGTYFLFLKSEDKLVWKQSIILQN